MRSERVDLKENAGYNVDMSARPRSERVGMCGRPAQARPRAGAWLGVWLLLVVPSLGWAARPWPDTSRRIVPFADQLPSDLNATQRWFAATHFAGTQKMLQSEIRAIRTYNTNFLCLHCH